MENLREPRKNVYKHLHPYERDEIAFMLAEGHTKNEIALKLNRHPSTIGREIVRNSSPIKVTCYRSNRAQIRADSRKRKSHYKQRLKTDEIRDYLLKSITKHHATTVRTLRDDTGLPYYTHRQPVGDNLRDGSFL